MTGHRTGYCGYCMKETTGFLVHEAADSWYLIGDGTYGTDRHYLLKCAQCANTFYQLVRTHSEDMSHEYDPAGQPSVYFNEKFEHYPQKPRIERPSWLPNLMLVDHGLYRIMCEVYGAYDRELRILATSGIRTAIDRLLETRGIDPSWPFKKKIDAAANGRVLDPRLMESMETLVEAGSAAIHRNWAPEDGEVRELLNLLERIIDNVCFSPDPETLKRLKGSVPKRQ